MDNQLPTPNTAPIPQASDKDPVTPNVIMPTATPEGAPAPTPMEVTPVPSAAAPAVAMPAATMPTAAATAPAAAPVVPAMPAPVPGAPAAAGDVDVIEPEWVDKAEQVIAAHPNDPYGEEEAVEKLQEEYLKKRYGMNVADPNSGDGKVNGS